VNGVRSLPFIVVLVPVIPLSLIARTSIGTAPAIVSLSISGVPCSGHVSEVALREVDRGLVDAVRAMGEGKWTIIREALVPQALPGLIAGLTGTLVVLVWASAMAGAVGQGGSAIWPSATATAVRDVRHNRLIVVLIALVRSFRPAETVG
jgi:D-methionine transport system permease protein